MTLDWLDHSKKTKADQANWDNQKQSENKHKLEHDHNYMKKTAHTDINAD